MPLLYPHDYDTTHELVARSSDLTPNATQRTTLIIAGCYIIIIGILWHVPYLNLIIYPFKLLTVGFHEMSHAFMGVLTCAHIHSIELDPDEGGATTMSGGIPWLTLPAGYLGSGLIGAALIACGFDTDASKVASLVLAVFFLFTLWWARRNLLTWVLLLGMSGLIVLFWFVKGGVALRYLVLFIGVMSCMYVLWDVIDDTIARKVNSSDASAFAKICGCFPSQVWGVIWLLIAFCFFILGVLVGIIAFKETAAEQAEDAKHFLPTPGTSSALALPVAAPLALLAGGLSSAALALL
ncbi:peptidase M50B-like-domain-containing protein [Lactarius akahatsu]|uniref:Peptidase M50B-like-domain-containing protein n=1 Tax=Lactarius akahatsu TaxID=416441 RepID=A0AAD4L7X2_9AGAM|nr:peptidase M50B-like-domain-containing protein [Lactarius akahatsu]